MKRLLIPALTLILAASPVLALPTVVSSAVNPTSGHYFYLLSPGTWTEAEAAAVSLGGHLATINDITEQSWLWSTWGAGRELWIGFNDAAQEGTFVWSSGEPVTFTNWQAGEPNNVGNEDYVYMRNVHQGRWNDYVNLPAADYPLYGVVEIVPEPCVSTLSILGGLFLTVRRSRS